MILRSVSLLLAGLFSLALSACKSMEYDDPPRPRFNEAYMGNSPPPMTPLRETTPPVIATDVEQPRVNAAPPTSSSQSTRMPPPPALTPKEYPVGTPVTGKPGFVTSPYKPYAGYVDVRGFSPGEQVKCPYSGKIFLVP
jgi:hypothetical protein